MSSWISCVVFINAYLALIASGATPSEGSDSACEAEQSHGLRQSSQNLTSDQVLLQVTRAKVIVLPATSGAEEPAAAAAGDVPPVNWYGVGRVTNGSFWENMRGVGFSPADDRGEWFTKEDTPYLGRLDDALTKVVENGFNMIRTWHTGHYQELILQHINDRGLNLKVQLGVGIDKDEGSRQLIDQAIDVARKYPHLILGLSVGNENMYFGNLYAEQIMEQAKYAREKYGIPVTYNFVRQDITDSRRRGKSAKSLELCAALDYVNVHLYGGHYDSGRYKRDWTPEAQVNAVKAEESSVLAKIGGDKPMIIGETGWQSEGYAASGVAKLREFYIRITRHVYSNATDSPARAMFYFNLNDESWKRRDDHWGLYAQGDQERIGDKTGAAKFQPTNVTRILAESKSPNVPAECCQPSSTWPQRVRSTSPCGNCTALVMASQFRGRCDKYCESFGHECVAASEEIDNTCQELYQAACDEEILETSDVLCTCRRPNCMATST